MKEIFPQLVKTVRYSSKRLKVYALKMTKPILSTPRELRERVTFEFSPYLIKYLGKVKLYRWKKL